MRWMRSPLREAGMPPGRAIRDRVTVGCCGSNSRMCKRSCQPAVSHSIVEEQGKEKGTYSDSGLSHVVRDGERMSSSRLGRETKSTVYEKLNRGVTKCMRQIVEQLWCSRLLERRTALVILIGDVDWANGGGLEVLCGLERDVCWDRGSRIVHSNVTLDKRGQRCWA